MQKAVNDDETPESHLYCEQHKSRLSRPYRCTSHDHVVESHEQLSGYEYGGKTIFLTGGEKAECEAVKTDRVALTSYVRSEDIDLLYTTDKSYLLWPQKGQEGAFALLRETLRESGKALVGKVTLFKTTRHMVIRWCPVTETLLATLCNYEANIRQQHAMEARERDNATPSEAELTLARQLLDSLPDAWEPESVTNEYTAAVLQAVAVKAGEATAEAPEVVEEAAAPDIMAALRASVEDVKKRTAKGEKVGVNPKNDPKNNPTPARKKQPARRTKAVA